MNAAQRNALNKKRPPPKEAPERCTVCGTTEIDNFDCPLSYDGHHTPSSK